MGCMACVHIYIGSTGGSACMRFLQMRVTVAYEHACIHAYT